MAFGGPRSSCVRPGAHSARHRDSHNDWTPCRMAEPFVSAGAHAPHPNEMHDPTPSRGSSHSARRAYAPSLSFALPWRTYREKHRGKPNRLCKIAEAMPLMLVTGKASSCEVEALSGIQATGWSYERKFWEHLLRRFLSNEIPSCCT